MRIMKLDYMPVQHNPARDVRVPSLPTKTVYDYGTPLKNFVMSWAGYMNMMAVGAAVLLVALIAINA